MRRLNQDLKTYVANLQALRHCFFNGFKRKKAV